MLVLDSSAAVRSALSTDINDPFSTLILSSTCVSPTLYLAETSNALWKEVRFNGLDPELVSPLQSTLLSLTDLQPDSGFIEDALAIAVASTHPIYDCLFIAMSRALEAPILTADMKMKRKFPDDAFVEIPSS